MDLKNRLTEKELKLLKDIGIEIERRKYNIDETSEIIERLDDAIRSNLDKYDNFTEKAFVYEEIQDKIIRYENDL